MTTHGTYWEGATVRLSATFKVSGTLTDPTTVTLKTLNPSGTTATYTLGDSEITKDSTGTYHKDVEASVVGTWVYRWIGTGAAAGVDEAAFIVTASAID